MVPDKSVCCGTLHIFKPIINKDAFARGKPEARECERVNRRIRLHELFVTRNDNIAETVKDFGMVIAEGWEKFMAEIGDREQRHCARIKFTHKF